ncbi:MAG: hypothetical protein CMH56_13165 [Myxococcales bacterium]|nr:hypothetical protein [Myxococcales bacterium]
MMGEGTYLVSALGAAVLILWMSSAALAIRFRVLRGKNLGRGLPLCILLGPLWVVVQLVQIQRHPYNVETHAPIKWGAGRFRDVFSPVHLLIGALITASSIFAGKFVGSELFEFQGEQLQLPIVTGLALGGLVAGLVMGRMLSRIAFLESLYVVFLCSCLPVVFFKDLNTLFTYGTAAAYFVLVLVAAALILVVSLTIGGAIGFLLSGETQSKASWAYESWIGRRFLMGKRTSNVVSLITVLSVFAVVVGTSGMVVVMSVMNGFSSDLRSKILGANAHLLVMKYGTDFTEYPEVMKKTRVLPGVVGATPFVINEVMISSDINLTGALIKGVDVDTVNEVTVLGDNMVKGELAHLKDPSKIEVPRSLKPVPEPTGTAPAQTEGDDEEAVDEEAALAAALAGTDADPAKGPPVLPGIVIGQEMAKNLKVFMGDVVNVVSPVGELGPTGPVPKARAFRVAGMFFSGMYEYDSKFVYIDLAEAQDFFSTNGGVTGVEYKVNDIDNTQGLGRQMLLALGGYPYRTKDWMEMNRNLFSALKLEKIAMFIILALTMYMASFLILVTLVMVVMEKGKEIAILKSMGATDTSVMKIFVTYGLFIGVLGGAVGLGMGFLLCLGIQEFGIGLDPEVYYITNLPVKIDVVEVCLVGSAAVVVSFLATIPPALFASRLSPVEGLRYE